MASRQLSPHELCQALRWETWRQVNFKAWGMSEQAAHAGYLAEAYLRRLEDSGIGLATPTEGEP